MGNEKRAAINTSGDPPIDPKLFVAIEKAIYDAFSATPNAEAALLVEMFAISKVATVMACPYVKQPTNDLLARMTQPALKAMRDELDKFLNASN